MHEPFRIKTKVSSKVIEQRLFQGLAIIACSIAIWIALFFYPLPQSPSPSERPTPMGVFFVISLIVCALGSRPYRRAKLAAEQPDFIQIDNHTLTYIRGRSTRQFALEDIESIDYFKKSGSWGLLLVSKRQTTLLPFFDAKSCSQLKKALKMLE